MSTPRSFHQHTDCLSFGLHLFDNRMMGWNLQFSLFFSLYKSLSINADFGPSDMTDISAMIHSSQLDILLLLANTRVLLGIALIIPALTQIGCRYWQERLRLAEGWANRAYFCTVAFLCLRRVCVFVVCHMSMYEQMYVSFFQWVQLRGFCLRSLFFFFLWFLSPSTCKLCDCT